MNKIGMVRIRREYWEFLDSLDKNCNKAIGILIESYKKENVNENVNKIFTRAEIKEIALEAIEEYANNR